MRRMTAGGAVRRQYPSGQSVPFDGMYVDSWGVRLPLLQGERLPSHRIMGASKWLYDGHLSSGLPAARVNRPPSPGRHQQARRVLHDGGRST
ncbi:hypothetical protein [Paenibacillus plantiphilus]|uniref:hypothetical protein n=1 Tax=Paenibacillus plantiphilus TaxID=2905650 RepID=UPI001F293B7E|nr:hypothetical protein [Paenibacillus plantiphilus]